MINQFITWKIIFSTDEVNYLSNIPLYKELIKLFKERNCNFIISFYDKK